MKKSILTFGLAFVYSAILAQQIIVPPYLQPGNVSSLSKEEKVILWQTDSIDGDFSVEYGLGTKIENVEKLSKAKISSVQLNLKGKRTFLYRATLSHLKFDEVYSYCVSVGGKTVANASFTTRTKNPKTRFAVFGDCGKGTIEQAEIAYQVYEKQPQFVLVTGDNVYELGLESEYRSNFFPYYLTPEPAPDKGAPLMRSIPFYMVLGNHDVYGANLDKYPDGLAYFYYGDYPLNAPVTSLTVEAIGDAQKIKAFKKSTGSRYPQMSNYSFDYGNVHIICLDANIYVNPLDPELVRWISEDIKSSKADWKIVAYHHPGFNASKAHYDQQWMRLLSPVLEPLGVDMVLSGHVHNYQRSFPLTFDPKIDESGTRYVISEDGRVDGKFVIDDKFDGREITKPTGIIYIVTGAGGAPLYDKSLSGNPDLWKHDPPENWVPFTAKMISDIHSFTMIETDGKTLSLKQFNKKGEIIDEIKVTK